MVFSRETVQTHIPMEQPMICMGFPGLLMGCLGCLGSKDCQTNQISQNSVCMRCSYKKFYITKVVDFLSSVDIVL